MTAYSKYHYYECADCGSVYLYGLLDYQSMYQGEDRVNGNFYIDEEIYNDRVQMIAEPKVKWIMDVCKRENISVDSWLDIGSGGGEILFSLKEKGISAIGIESDRIEYRFSLEKGLDVRNLRVDFKSKEVGKLIQDADVISFFNVLEHIPKSQKFIDYIYDNMKTGGLMVFEVPRHPSLASFANITGRDFAYRHIVPPGHVTVFSEAGIERLLSGSFKFWASGVLDRGMLTSLTMRCCGLRKERTVYMRKCLVSVMMYKKQ